MVVEKKTLCFINTETEKTEFEIDIKNWRYHSLRNCDHSPSTLVAISQDILKKTIKLRIIECFRIKDKYMHLLLHLNEDFDDDLLSDALNVLGRND